MKNTQIREEEPMDFDYYYDQKVSDVEWNGNKVDQVKLPIYTCERDMPPMYPDGDRQGSSRFD